MEISTPHLFIALNPSRQVSVTEAEINLGITGEMRKYVKYALCDNLSLSGNNLRNMYCVIISSGYMSVSFGGPLGNFCITA